MDDKTHSAHPIFVYLPIRMTKRIPMQYMVNEQLVSDSII